MVLRIAQWTLDVDDVGLMAEFWSAALGLEIDRGDDGAAKLYPPSSAPPTAPTLWLQPTAGPKTAKNRCHPDLWAPEGQAESEVHRLLALGATHADVGQTGHEDFAVLADPEGNEFCILFRDPRAQRLAVRGQLTE